MKSMFQTVGKKNNDPKHGQRASEVSPTKTVSESGDFRSPVWSEFGPAPAVVQQKTGSKGPAQHLAPHIVQQPLIVQQSTAPHQIQRTPDEPKGVKEWWDPSPDVDITNPIVQENLKKLSRKELLEMLKWVRDPSARLFIQQLAAPQKVERIGGGIPSLSQADLDNLAKPSAWGGYWGSKILNAYKVTPYSPVGDRFGKNNDERDAVLAALWQERPTQVTQYEMKHVSVSISRPGKTGADKMVSVHYRFVFQSGAPGKNPNLEIHFEREVPSSQSRQVTIGRGYDTFKPSEYEPDTELNFPVGTAKEYWANRKQERKKLFYWIERQMAGDIDSQEVEVDGISYKVSAKKDSQGKLTYLDLEWQGRNFRKQVKPRLDPEKRDAMDFELEQLQDPAAKGGPLADVILEGVPEDEAFSVKAAIWQNFRAGLRNREIEVLVPIALTKRRVFYTLRFRPNNEVDVERLGEEGSSAAFSPDKMSIQRARGYPADQNDLAVHTAWLKKRYKALTINGSTPEELRENADKELVRRTKTPEWLKSNYGMPVLDATAADKRLRSAHKISAKARAGLKTFTPKELTLIEQGLQPMSDTFVKKLKNVQLIRQSDFLQSNGTPFPEEQQAGAQTLISGSTFSIRFFDNWRPEREHFIGGTSGVHQGSSALPVHEFGHVLESKMRLLKAFNALVKKEGATPYTDYAARKPGTELFTEALWIYELDPEWLKTNHPQLYTWIDKRSGK